MMAIAISLLAFGQNGFFVVMIEIAFSVLIFADWLEAGRVRTPIWLVFIIGMLLMLGFLLPTVTTR